MCSIAPVLGLFAAKKALTPSTPKTPDAVTPASPAAAVAAPDAKQDTGIDTTGASLKRKARGKKGLMIAANTSAGGSSGGTGLNL